MPRRPNDSRILDVARTAGPGTPQRRWTWAGLLAAGLVLVPVARERAIR